MRPTASQPQAADWLLENSPGALELLVRAIFYHNSVPIVIADNDRKHLDASIGAGNLFGLARDKLIGHRIDDFTEPTSWPRIEEMWRAFLRQGEQQGTFGLLDPEGNVQEVAFIAKGNVLPGRHLLVLHKKTAKKQPAGADGSDDEQVPSWVKDYALFVLAADGRIVEWHSGAERIYGYRREEIIGQHAACVYAGDETDPRLKLQVELKRTASEGRLGNEGWHQRKDGARFWANALTMALRDDNQILRGFASVVRDFTGRHRTEEALRQSAGRVRQRAPESTVVGIVSGEFDRITEVSDAFLRMVGYSREELTAGDLTWPDLTPPEYSPLDDLAHDEDLMYGACTPFEKAYIRKDGTRVPVLVTGAVLDFSPFRWITFVQDLSDHEREETVDPEFPAPHIFQEIVGNSSALKRVLAQVEIVAPTDATVLLLGETGTGKELVARAIYKLSARRERPFVTVNCAAIPTGLLESELFGYEKGAFTGALSRKIGRFELAHKGTLLLDEVGDIPLDLQPKLLRALQEKEFERLGSVRTIPIDVRLIAATNRNLTQMMGDKLFRSDLYYRLKVFPITIPPLRDHPEDIPVLTRYFVQKYAEQMNKQIETIPPQTMRALVSWHWPGNVRELENFIERSVILSRGPILRAPPLDEIREVGVEAAGGITLEQVEREHIIRVLRETGGNKKKAAEILRVSLKTVYNKIKQYKLEP